MPYSGKDQKWLESQLQTDLIGKVIVLKGSVESTNDLTKTLAQKGAADGTVVLADSQTQGRGRRGREWSSEANVGIYLSILLHPTLSPEQAHQITLVAGVGLIEAINTFSQTRAVLKWPNDVLINNKKVAGILTEFYQGGDHNGIILGIGVNVNNSRFPVELQHIATSLAMENSGSLDKLPIIAAIINNIEKEYWRFMDGEFPTIIDEWNQNSDIFGRHISLSLGEQTFYGTAMKLDEEGQLVLETETGEEVAFDSGEITLLD